MADKKKILIADDFQLLREDLTELINNQRRYFSNAGNTGG